MTDLSKPVCPIMGPGMLIVDTEFSVMHSLTECPNDRVLCDATGCFEGSVDRSKILDGAVFPRQPATSKMVFSQVISTLVAILERSNVDLIYLAWLWALFKPLCMLLLSLFLLPAVILLFMYGSSLFCLIYKHWHRLKAAYSEDVWYGAIKTLAVFWELQATIWHGYEVEGLENIPATGPVLIVFYHAALPIDFYYVFAKIWLYRNRRVRVVADKFVFKIPGLATLLEALEIQPATSAMCKLMLEEGHVLAVSPGGVREALFGDHNYQLIWKERKGFAKVAIDAKTPIIPMFTKNSREAVRAMTFGRRFLRYVYEKTRLPLVPIYGIFPVKMITYLGEPIPYDPNVTPDILAHRVKTQIEKMIDTHQRRPGSITRAFLDRFITSSKEN